MSAYAKNVFRTIWGNKRRSLLLLLITAMGAAFYVGLRSTSPDMNLTFDHYFDRQQMCDIRVLSNFGLSNKDIGLLRAVEGVSRVEPAYATDLFAKWGDASYLIRIHSGAPPGAEGSTSGNPRIIEGRMPTFPGECAVAHRFALISGCAVGDTVTLSTGDDTRLTDFLSQETFVITGLIESPLYLMADLGTSDKGSGTLQSYAYVLFEDFTLTNYTEAQIFLYNPLKLSRFDERFEDMSAAVEEALQTVGDRIVVRRRRVIIEKASGEIAKGIRELDDTRVKLAQSEQALLDAEHALMESESGLLFRRGDLIREVGDSRRMMDAGYDALMKARQDIGQGRYAIMVARRELQDAQRNLDSSGGMTSGSASSGILFGNDDADSDDAGSATGTSASAADPVVADSNPTRTIGSATVSAFSAAAPGQTLDASYIAAALAALDAREQELAISEAALEEQFIASLSNEAAFSSVLYSRLAQLAMAEAELSLARDTLADNRMAFEAEKASADALMESASRSLAAARRAIDEVPEAKCYVLGLDKNLNFASYRQDSERIDSISKVFPVTFFLVAALVSFTGMFRIVEDDRSTIAAMQSLGYGPGAVFGKYFLYAMSVGIPGILFGIAIGYWLFPSAIFNFGYKIMYLLPAIETPLHIRFCMLASVISLISIASPIYIVTMADMRENPAALMRPKAPPPGKRIVLENVKALWSAMDFSAKVTARNILRYKKRFFMSVTGIAGCTAIVLTGFGVRDSIKTVPVNQFDRILLHAFQITLSDSARRSDRTSLERYLATQDDVREMGYQYRENIDVQIPGRTKSYAATLVVPAEPDRLSDFVYLARPRTGEAVAPTINAVVISQKLASLLNVSSGDTLSMTADNDAEYTIQIRDATENYVGHYVYMAPEYYRTLTGALPDYTTIVCLAGDIGEERRDTLSQHILDNDSVSALSFKERTRDFYSDLLDSLNVIVLILIIAGALLAFVVLFSLTGINIDERKREIASLKVLGFYDGEASSYIFRENTVNTVVGVAAGLVFGIALHQFVIRTAEVDMILFGKSVAPISFVYASALTFFYTFVVNTAMVGSIRSIDMIESLKSVE